MVSDTALKSTPLLSLHQQLNARLVPFAGWNMPIQYKGVIEEHRAVREAVGLFDVSHMGEVDIEGPGALDFLQYLVTHDVETMTDGSALYTVMCYEDGGVVDDLLIHRFSNDHYFLCVNAANTDKDFEWIAKHAEAFDVRVKNTSDETAQLAIQGRHAEALLQKLTSVPLADLKYYHFTQGKIAGAEAIIARTGYTGEDGFEIYIASEQALSVAEQVFSYGAAFDLQPIGLGARDTLRLEMGYALYGHEITAKLNPLEARLGWVVKLDKPMDFVGKQALAELKVKGLSKRLAGVRVTGRGVPRDHYPVLHDGKPVGEVTSGTFSPSLNQGVALCYVPVELSKAGARVEIEIRKQAVTAEVTALPFVASRVKK